MKKYTIQETHQMLREAAVYVDETGDGYQVEYVEDLEQDPDGNFYANVMLRTEDTMDQVEISIADIDLGARGVLLYRLELMNP